MPREYDVAVIGAGPAGYVAAIKLRQLDKSVCVIDISEERLGGVCLNEGCIPAKAIIHSSKLFSAIKNAASYGIEAEVRAPDMKKIAASSQGAASQLRNGIKSLFTKYGVEFIAGKARIVSKNEISVKAKDGKEEKVKAGKIIIASGSSAKIPLNITSDGEAVLTSKEAIKLEKLPKDLLVVGAGAIGVEFSSTFASFGAKVTLVEAMSNILPLEDEEISKALARIFKKRGIDVFVNTSLKSLQKKNGSVEAVLETNGAEKKAKFDRVLIAAGRRPNTEDIGLEKAGVKLKDGFIVTDGRMRTNISGIYAAGDVVDTPMYAHVAYSEGVAAAEDIAGIKAGTINYENIPNVVFSEPQVASVGLTEAKACEKSEEIAISKHFFKANGMAVATHREDGFIKIIADKNTRAILGAHIIGGEATEIVHEFVVAKKSGLKADDIAKAVHAHPTFSEAAASAAHGLFH